MSENSAKFPPAVAVPFLLGISADLTLLLREGNRLGVFSLILFGFCGLQLFTGRLRLRSGEYVTREQSPYTFWSSIAMFLVLGWGLLLLGFFPQLGRTPLSLPSATSSIVDLSLWLFLFGSLGSAIWLILFGWRYVPHRYLIRFPHLFLMQHQNAYLFTMISVFAKLAKADGFISSAEVKAVHDFMETKLQLPPKRIAIAVNIFRKALHADVSFDQYVELFYSIFRGEPGLRIYFIEALMWLSSADGNISTEEEYHIQRAAQRFGVRPGIYAQIKARYSGPAAAHERKGEQHSAHQHRSEEQRFQQSTQQETRDELFRHFETLQCSPSASWTEIKRQFRKLIFEHHPDRLLAKGVPKAVLQSATRRCQEINEAYEAIRQVRAPAAER